MTTAPPAVEGGPLATAYAFAAQRRVAEDPRT